MKKTFITLLMVGTCFEILAQSATVLPQQSTVKSNTVDNTALTGQNDATTGSETIGVKGVTASAGSGVSGVLGFVSSTSPGARSAGVRGANNGTGSAGIGVAGYQGGGGWGVYGETPSGIGVYGLTTSIAASAVGVRGETLSPNGIGVKAKYSGSGTGTALEIDNGAIRVTGTNKPAFVHTATAANSSSSNSTTIDHPLCNGDPNALLFVTQKINPPAYVYNNSPIGVYYNTNTNKWEIFNQNTTPVPVNAQFNVLVIKQ